MNKNPFQYIPLIIGVLLVSLPVFSQAPDLSDWKIDTLNSQNVGIAIHSKDNWVFVKKENQTVIEQNQYRSHKGDSLPFRKDFIEKKLNAYLSNYFVKSVKKGYLIGIDNGEFGGGLFFISRSGESSYKIDGFQRIEEIFEFGSKFYATSGLSHFVTNYGYILELSLDETWQISTKVELPEEPDILIHRNNSLFIVTSQFILRVDKGMNIYKVLKSPVYWGILYPSSAIIDDKDIFIAMRKGIMKIEDFETDPNYQWYIPK